MNMAGTLASDFADARPVAQHCAELTWRGPRPEERAENLAAWRRELAGNLAQELEQLLAGGKLEVTLAEPEMLGGREVFERIGPVGCNCLLRCGDADQTVLFSLDYSTAVALTDRSFGGEGEMPESEPLQLPRSAAMLAENLASMVAYSIASANGGGQRSGGEVLVRSESAKRLKPFSEEAEVAFFRLTLSSGQFATWHAALAVASDRLDGLLPDSAGPSRPRRNFAGGGDAMAGVVEGLLMPVTALLGTVEMSLERLENLKAGEELPLAVARDVPLMMDGQVLAHGAPGTFEDRLALRLTNVSGKPSAVTSRSTQHKQSMQGENA